MLNELRESYICLKIIYRANLYKSEEKMKLAMNECNELISIFATSVATAQKNDDNNDADENMELFSKSKIVNPCSEIS